MPVISAIFLIVALVLAVVLGPKTHAWLWGPSMMALGIAVLAAVPELWKRGKAQLDFGLVVLGAITAAWFAWRAWMSPVAQLGQTDLLLVAGVVGAFVSIQAISGDVRAERVLIWGIALLLLANVVVIGKQLQDPGFSPVFGLRVAGLPSGFYTHYNEAANYLIVSSLLVGAGVLFGRQGLLTRSLWFLIAIAGLAGVWFTRSRGGILGAAVACGVFAVIALMMGHRRRARWFAPALIAIPLVGLAVGAFLFMGWQSAQEQRHPGTGIEQLLDNDCRLYFLGLAFSCIKLHPFVGGGSRSFSWECYRFWEHDVQGAGGVRPEMVHNELVQSAADYGLVGAGLLAGLFGALVLIVVLRILFERIPDEPDERDAWRLGALAGLVGMFVQSCFSFVFHLMPGILLLGICMGRLSRPTQRSTAWKIVWTRILLSITALACAVLMISAGWIGSQVARILWAEYFSGQGTFSRESRLDAYSEAIELWPRFEFYQARGELILKGTGSNGLAGSREVVERARSDYQEACRLHPCDPGLAVNLANQFSYLGRDSEAEAYYARVIELQGGMEAGFRGRFSFAMHLFHQGLKQFRAGSSEVALAVLERAVVQMEEAVKQTPPYGFSFEERASRIFLYERLGAVRAAMGDRDGALKAYDLACLIPTGSGVHYQAAVLIGKTAVDEWSKRRPSEALGHFMEARKRLGQAGSALPQGVTASQRAEYLVYLDRMIAFLKGAKIEPATQVLE